MTPRLTHDQVANIIGRRDDIKIADIVACGASAAELIEARRWSEGYLRDLGEALPMRPAVVSKLCDMLRADERRRQHR